MLDHTLFEGNGAHAYSTGPRPPEKPGQVEDRAAPGWDLRTADPRGPAFLSSKLEAGHLCRREENIRVLLPNSAAVAVVLLALQTIRRVPAIAELLRRARERACGGMNAAQVNDRLDLEGLHRRRQARKMPDRG